jgi:hypothetical protein
MKILTLIYIVVISAVSLHADTNQPGVNYDLSDSLGLSEGQYVRVFLPAGIIGTTEPRIPVIIHFHGSNDVMEEQISALKNGAVLCTVHLGNLSGPYRNYFSDRAAFRKILHHLNGVLAKSGMDYGERKPELILTSFSAGYAAVREILLDEGYFDTVRAVLLADGLHTDSDPLLMEQQMRSFLRYAQDAQKGKKIFYITHSGIQPPGYAGTTGTAEYLIEHTEGRRIAVSVSDTIGERHYEYSAGNFIVWGYYGETGEDHMKHLRGMHLMLGEVIRRMGIGK